jgi:hypothetical protein
MSVLSVSGVALCHTAMVCSTHRKKGERNDEHRFGADLGGDSCPPLARLLCLWRIHPLAQPLEGSPPKERFHHVRLCDFHDLRLWFLLWHGFVRRYPWPQALAVGAGARADSTRQAQAHVRHVRFVRFDSFALDVRFVRFVVFVHLDLTCPPPPGESLRSTLRIPGIFPGLLRFDFNDRPSYPQLVDKLRYDKKSLEFITIWLRHGVSTWQGYPHLPVDKSCGVGHKTLFWECPFCPHSRAFIVRPSYYNGGIERKGIP